MKKLSALLVLLLFLVLPASASLAGDDYIALSTSIRVLGSNGTVTAGVRLVPRAGGTQTTKDGTYTYHRYEMVYTTDGTHWKIGTLDGATSKRSTSCYAPTPERYLNVLTDDEARAKSPDPAYGVYTGSTFLAYGESCHTPSYQSSDGMHWTTIPAESAGSFPTVPPDAVNLGSYRFELDSLGEQLYLVAGDRAILLEDVGKNKPEGNLFTDVKAFYLPGGFLRVELYTSNMPMESPAYVTVYASSSLDWVLKHKTPLAWTPAESIRVAHGTTVIRGLNVGYDGTRWECGVQKTPSEPIQWQAIAAPWTWEKEQVTLYPWNGKSFVLLDRWTLQLYASEDGANWRSLGTTFLAPDEAVDTQSYYPFFQSTHAITWTGGEYMACRRTTEGRHGMMGSSGGYWNSPTCSKLYFADQNFQKTSEYDFGRQVEAVGYQNGVYYAKVSRSAYLCDGIATTIESKEGSYLDISVPGYGMDTTESDLYTSTDKVTWTKSTLNPTSVPLVALA